MIRPISRVTFKVKPLSTVRFGVCSFQRDDPYPPMIYPPPLYRFSKLQWNSVRVQRRYPLPECDYPAMPARTGGGFNPTARQFQPGGVQASRDFVSLVHCVFPFFVIFKSVGNPALAISWAIEGGTGVCSPVVVSIATSTRLRGVEALSGVSTASL